MIINHIVEAGEAGKRLSVILKYKMRLSGGCIKALKRTGAYDVNGDCPYMNYILKAGDIISVDIADKEDSSVIVPVDMNIKILYRDECFIAVEKPAHMPVHPSVHHYEDTLSNGIMFLLENSEIENAVIHPIIRLDMDTSGIVLFALNAHTHSLMNGSDFKIEKKYYAVFEGYLSNDSGLLDFPIARESDSMIKRTVSPDGKNAVTEYRVLKRFCNMTFGEIKLHTGRTHQIRVHFSHIGHPIVGDTLYGCSSKYIDRQALHASEISFIHPFSGETVYIKSELPYDMKAWTSLQNCSDSISNP